MIAASRDSMTATGGRRERSCSQLQGCPGGEWLSPLGGGRADRGDLCLALCLALIGPGEFHVFRDRTRPGSRRDRKEQGRGRAKLF